MMRLPEPVNAATSPRRGAVFHYYLVYMLLTSVLLSTAGFCLHMILHADHMDRRVSQHLKTLLKFDRSLREDFASTPTCNVMANTLEIANADSASLKTVYTIDSNRVRRASIANSETISREAFVFPTATTVHWAVDQDLLIITLTEAPVRNRDEPVEGAARPETQILLPMSSAGNADDETVSDTAASDDAVDDANATPDPTAERETQP